MTEKQAQTPTPPPPFLPEDAGDKSLQPQLIEFLENYHKWYYSQKAEEQL